MSEVLDTIWRKVVWKQWKIVFTHVLLQNLSDFLLVVIKLISNAKICAIRKDNFFISEEGIQIFNLTTFQRIWYVYLNYSIINHFWLILFSQIEKQTLVKHNKATGYLTLWMNKWNTGKSNPILLLNESIILICSTNITSNNTAS